MGGGLGARHGGRARLLLYDPRIPEKERAPLRRDPRRLTAYRERKAGWQNRSLCAYYEAGGNSYFYVQGDNKNVSFLSFAFGLCLLRFVRMRERECAFGERVRLLERL